MFNSVLSSLGQIGVGVDGLSGPYMLVGVLCITTSFQVLRAPESWSNYFFQLFSTFFVHSKISVEVSDPKSGAP